MSGAAFKVLFLMAVLMTSMSLFAAEAGAEKKIGILIWSEESRYAEAKNSVIEQLAKEGFGEPKAKFFIEGASGNKAKAAELARKFSSAKMDMVIAVGTSAAVAAAREIKDIPVVFTMVYDPVDSKIADDWKSSGNNTTGASSKVPMTRLMGSLKQFAPVKRLAVLYTPGEKNSETQLKEILAEQGAAQIKVVPVPLSRKDEVGELLTEVAGAVDAIYLSGSSIVGESITTIVDTATRAKVVTVTHLDDFLDKGVLLGVCANPRDVGLLAGAKAAKVLKGAQPSSIPIEPLKNLDVLLNMKTAQSGHFDVSPAFRETVTRVIE